MRKSIILGVLALGIVLAVAACGGSQPTVAPTTAPAVATSAPAATNAPAPTNAPAATSAPAATNAPAATTASTNPTAASSSGGTSDFQRALENAKEAKVFRVDMSLKASGKLLGLGGENAPASDEPETLMTMNGAVKDKDSDMKIGGLLIGLMAGFMGFDPEKELEFMKVGDKNFIKGTMVGKTEAEWYILEGPQDATQTPVSPGRILDSLEEANLKPTDFTKSGTETLDNLSCEVYAADKAAVIKAFGSIGTADEPLDASDVDDATLKFYICSDGYLHQMVMELTAHEKDDPAKKGTFALNMHVYDIDGNIVIEAPTDAKPLEFPGFGGEETPTMTPTP